MQDKKKWLTSVKIPEYSEFQNYLQIKEMIKTELSLLFRVMY